MTGIIFINDINVCPYLEKYITCLEAIDEPYDIIIWDRSFYKEKKYKYPCKFVYTQRSKEDKHYLLKIAEFYGYRQYLKKLIVKEKYDKLILLSTFSALLVYDLLATFENRYIFDYRDASFEYFKPFTYLLNKVIEKSNFTCISSRGFEKILPIHNYILAHNFKYSDLKIAEKKEQNDLTKKIIVSCIGLLRPYYSTLVDKFGNDNRFEFYIDGGGDNYKQIEQYSKQYNNVFFGGSYKDDQKYKLINRADILCYYYPESYNRNLAIANKLYDGLIFKKPLLGNINTYSGELILEKGIGISLDLKDKCFTDKLFDYWTHLDYQQFIKNTEYYLNEVMDDDTLYLDTIRKFIEYK